MLTVYQQTVPAKSANRGKFYIDGSRDGGAATRAVSMFVAQACGLGWLSKPAQKVTHGKRQRRRDADLFVVCEMCLKLFDTFKDMFDMC